MIQHPFFVYGTLLPGQLNDHYWGNNIVRSAPAVLSHAVLYLCSYYPMMIEQVAIEQKVENRVVGQLIWIRPQAYRDTLVELDILEGYDPADSEQSHYRRLQRTVTTGNGTDIVAWVYLGKPRFVEGLPLIPDGDWEKFMVRKNKFLSKNSW